LIQYGRLVRRLVCKPRRRPSLQVPGPPAEPLARLMARSAAYDSAGAGVALLRPRKPLRLPEAEDVLSWFDFDACKDLLVFPSPCWQYRQDCDPSRNTVQLYAIRVPETSPPVDIVRPGAYYVTDYTELVATLREIVSGREARIYVVSKYARPGNLMNFVRRLNAKSVKLYIATREHITQRYNVDAPANVYAVHTDSHRKLVFAVVGNGAGDKLEVVGYRGSMNLFFPGIDDYMEAVKTMEELLVLAHGLIRAFLLV